MSVDTDTCSPPSSEESSIAIDPQAVTSLVVTVDVGGDYTVYAQFAMQRDGTGSCTLVEESHESGTVEGLVDVVEKTISEACAGELGPVDLLDGCLTVRTKLNELESAAEEFFVDVFREQVNDMLDDPFQSSDDLEDCETYFENGFTEAVFDRLIHLAQLAYRNALDGDTPMSVYETSIACASDDGDVAELSDQDDSPEALHPILDALIEAASPTGWTMEYNDGASDRASGYSKSVNWLSYSSDDSDELSARERVQAARLLVEEAAVLSVDLQPLVDVMHASLKTAAFAGVRNG